MPARPSISTRHSRQEPKASTMSVAQSFGICVPASIAARMIEVPSGTVTLLPSMVSVTIVSDFERGVPKSISWISDMAWSSIPRPAGVAGAGPKSSGKCFRALMTG